VSTWNITAKPFGEQMRFAFAEGEMRLPAGDAFKNPKLFGILRLFFIGTASA